MTDDEILSELRRLIEEEMGGDLKAIAAKLDCIQEQMERHDKALHSRLDAILAEQTAFRAERTEQAWESEESTSDTTPKKPILQ
jgi:hypothetical protein